MSPPPTRLKVKRAQEWLAALRQTVAAPKGTNPKDRSLSQIMAIHFAIQNWPTSYGVFEHAIVVLAYEEGLSIDPRHGVLGLVPRLARDMSKQSASNWGRALEALRSDRLTLEELAAYGIEQAPAMATKGLRTSTRPLWRGTVPASQAVRKLRSGSPRK